MDLQHQRLVVESFMSWDLHKQGASGALIPMRGLVQHCAPETPAPTNAESIHMFMGGGHEHSCHGHEARLIQVLISHEATGSP